jgi:hypothetical protein
MKRLMTWLRERRPGWHPGIARIISWCDGRSDSTDARRVAAHLISCPGCRRHAELLYAARQARRSPAAEINGGAEIDEGLRNLQAQMRAWRYLQGRGACHRQPSFTPSTINRRIGAALTLYFGRRAAAHLERSAEHDERHLFPASQALFTAFLGKRAAEALTQRIVRTVAP